MNSIYDKSRLTARAYEQDRAEKAIQTITESTPAPETPGKLKFLSFDLNDLDSVKTAAATFAQQEPKLDVLWNNAGTGANMVNAGSKTKQGFETMVGMHCVATLLFTQLVLLQLRAAVAAPTTPGSVRVVWTSSFLAEAHRQRTGSTSPLSRTGYPTGRRTTPCRRLGRGCLLGKWHAAMATARMTS